MPFGEGDLAIVPCMPDEGAGLKCARLAHIFLYRFHPSAVEVIIFFHKEESPPRSLMRAASILIGACVSLAQWRIVSASYIDASTCVDPSGFSQCYSAASSAAATCFAKNCHSGSCTDDDDCSTNDENDLCAPSCICVAYQTWINCALTSCWNQVSCPLPFLFYVKRDICMAILSC
jgi:hypothetical protein